MARCYYCGNAEQREERWDFLIDKDFTYKVRAKVEQELDEGAISMNGHIDVNENFYTILSVTDNRLDLIISRDPSVGAEKVFRKKINYCPMCGRKLEKGEN